MKKIIPTISILLLLPLFMSAQIAEKNSIFISTGKVYFPDIYGNRNNFSVGINYQNRFAKFFAWEVYYEYAQSRFIPKDMNAYMFGLPWNEKMIYTFIDSKDIHTIYNHVLGAKLHASFVNNDRWFFSIYGGLGYHFTRTGSYTLDRFILTVDPTDETTTLKEYDGHRIKVPTNKPVGRLGFQSHFTFYKNWIVGLDLSLTRQIYNTDLPLNSPPIMDNYKASILIGKKF